MRLESPLPLKTIQPRHYRWLQFLLLTGFAICSVISILALVILWWLSSNTPVRSTASASALQIESEQVLPELALMYLAGDPVDALVNQAIRAAEYETGHALLTFGISIMSPTRNAVLLQLAQRFQEHEKRELAAQLLRSGRAIAILDTQLSPLEQADALLQCVMGFLTLDLIAEATDTAYQVKRIAEQTPDLLPAERNRLLQNLLPLTARLQDDTLRQQVQELARSPYLSPDGIVIQRMLPFGGPLAEDPAAESLAEFESELTATARATLHATVRERQQLARQLADTILRAPLADVTPLRTILEEALRKEDEQRSLYFTQVLASENLTLPLQFWSLHEQHEWLLLKLAIAHRAFGLTLVPAWEEDRVAIAQSLADITDQLAAILSTSAEPQPELFDQLIQRIVVLRWLAMQIELGFYPLQKAVEIGEQLRIAQGELAIHGTVAALPIHYHGDATLPGYRIDSPR